MTDCNENFPCRVKRRNHFEDTPIDGVTGASECSADGVIVVESVVHSSRGSVRMATVDVRIGRRKVRDDGCEGNHISDGVTSNIHFMIANSAAYPML